MTMSRRPSTYVIRPEGASLRNPHGVELAHDDPERIANYSGFSFDPDDVQRFVSLCQAAVESAPKIDVPDGARGLTLSAAQSLDYRSEVYHRTRNDSRGAPMRARVNGKLKVFKKPNPDGSVRWELPMKYGFSEAFTIASAYAGGDSTGRNPDNWSLDEDGGRGWVTVDDVRARWSRFTRGNVTFVDDRVVAPSLVLAHQLNPMTMQHSLMIYIDDVTLQSGDLTCVRPWVPFPLKPHDEVVDEWRDARGWTDGVRWFGYDGVVPPWEENGESAVGVSNVVHAHDTNSMFWRARWDDERKTSSQRHADLLAGRRGPEDDDDGAYGT